MRMMDSNSSKCLRFRVNEGGFTLWYDDYLTTLVFPVFTNDFDDDGWDGRFLFVFW